MPNKKPLSKIWMDGNIIDGVNARVPLLTHTLHYGMGVFEGVRAYATPQGPAIFRLEAHTDRLFHSAAIIGLTIPYTKQQLLEAQKDLIKINGLQSAYLRPLVYLGDEHLGLYVDDISVHVAIAAWGWDAYLGQDAKQKGVSIGTSSLRRQHPNATFNQAKACGYYINASIALMEAKRNGYHDALLLDNQGYVAEGTGANIFIVRDNQLFTLETGNIIAGITRDTIIQLAHEQNIAITEKRLTREDVYTADEAFFTGTAFEIIPITACDKHAIGNGAAGPITKALQQAYFDLVTGKFHTTHPWLSYCT